MILNPWWEVPKSIEHEAAGKKGFVAGQGPDGKIQRWRQPPGPTNALGQIKFVMPNSKAIYLHDTNARSRFNSDTPRAQPRLRPDRSISSTSPPSCSATTAASGRRRGSRRRSTARRRVQANFVKPLPVYIVYFSSAALNDGRIVDYKDLYGRDSKAMAALHMKDGGASLAPPKVKPERRAPSLSASQGRSPLTRSHALARRLLRLKFARFALTGRG